MILTIDSEELENILAENRHLRGQVDTLQTRMSEMVYERQKASEKPATNAWLGDKAGK
jgi:regulator of replication initiation timing